MLKQDHFEKKSDPATAARGLGAMPLHLCHCAAVFLLLLHLTTKLNPLKARVGHIIRPKDSLQLSKQSISPWRHKYRYLGGGWFPVTGWLFPEILNSPVFQIAINRSHRVHYKSMLSYMNDWIRVTGCVRITPPCGSCHKDLRWPSERAANSCGVVPQIGSTVALQQRAPAERGSWWQLHWVLLSRLSHTRSSWVGLSDFMDLKHNSHQGALHYKTMWRVMGKVRHATLAR